MSTKYEKEQKVNSQEELKKCPKCGRRMTWIDDDIGNFRQWCYNCDSVYLEYPTLGSSRK